MTPVLFGQILAQASGDSSPAAGGLLFVGFLVLLGLAVAAFWLWSLIHCATNRRISDTNRLVGILLIVFLGPLGSLIYLMLPRAS